MTGEEMLFEMIVKANQSVLDELNVQLLLEELDFSWPAVRNGGEEYNTVVTATATGEYIEGDQSYYYMRPDIQQAFADLGYPEVSINMDPELVNEVTLLMALKTKHNLSLKHTDIKSYEFDGVYARFEVKPTNYIFTGSLTVKVTVDSLSLAEHFPNNVLNGLFIGDDLAVNAPTTRLMGFQEEN